MLILFSPRNLPPSSSSMRTTALFSPLSLLRLKPPLPHPLPFPTPRRFPSLLLSRFSSLSNSVEHLQEKWDLHSDNDESASGSKLFDFDAGNVDLKHLNSVPLEVKELEELPEQWRRSKIAWLCKELPAHKSSTFVRILNAQRKWLAQEDITYVAVHCMRIRENEAAFKVYKWMMQQPKFKFDFALATKLADYMGKERKCLRCREIFDDIINQGRVPSESTFHVLIVAYLSSSAPWCLVEACSIYNRMIQLGGYQPRLHLHNSLFKSIVSDVGGPSMHNLKQAEFIFHYMVTSGLEVSKDIYGGLIWLHSNQESIDRERIEALRKEMSRAGMEEGKDVLLSILRACCKEGDVVEAENTWNKLLHADGGLPSQAFVCKMEVFAKAGDPMKSLKTFREMQTTLSRTTVAAYHKIIEVLSEAHEIELAESLMTEFVESGLRPLIPSFIDLMTMYLSLGLNDKLEFIFYQSLERSSPDRMVYSIYLDSLVKTGNLVKAEEIFNQMLSTEAVGVNTHSCNSLLRGHINSGDYVKAEKIYDLMCQKKYDIEADLMEKLDFVLSLSRKVVKKPISLKLSKEKREMLVGLLLGGLRMESDEERKNHAIYFEFKQDHGMHIYLKRHLYVQFHEWLSNSCRPPPGDDTTPDRFYTILHTYFGFYADQFWPKGRSMIPKLIHRWLSPRVLAYWYMYAGHRTSSGDILLKVKGDPEGVEKIVKTLRAKSLDCKVKRKGRVFWIGFLGSNSTWFWKLTEPHILDEIKDLLKPDEVTSIDGASDSDENSFDYSDDGNSS